MIETVLVVVLVFGITIVIGVAVAPPVQVGLPMRGEVNCPGSDQMAKCVMVSTVGWCCDDDFSEEIPSGMVVPVWHRNTEEEEIMNRGSLAASVLTAAIGLAASAVTGPASAAEMTKEQMMQMQQQMQKKMATEHLEQCYGVNAVGRNDCGGGVHSCSGQATQARDPQSFILVPMGVCNKIAGGSLKPA